MKFQGWIHYQLPDKQEYHSKIKVQCNAHTLPDVVKWMETQVPDTKCAIISQNKVLVWCERASILVDFEIVDVWSTDVDSTMFKGDLIYTPTACLEVVNLPPSRQRSTKQHKQKVPARYAEVWGLTTDMNLVNECADIYILEELNRVYSNRDSENLDVRLQTRYQDSLSRLEHNFKWYLTMIIGGEVRHMSRCIDYYAAQKVTDDIKGVAQKQAYTEVLHEIYYGGSERGEPDREWCEDCDCYHYNDAGFNQHSRKGMWVKWHELYQKHDINIIYAARDFYRMDGWGHTFGGNKWAVLCDCVIRHMEGRDTPLIFVDTVWSLEHNGGNCLNKVWNTSKKLKDILDAKFNGDAPYLAKYASDWTRKLWEERTGNVATTQTKAERIKAGEWKFMTVPARLNSR